MKNILVMQLFRFGDVLQTTPAIAALRAAHPDACIHFMVRKAFAQVLRHNPHVDEIIEWDMDALYARTGDARPVLKNLRELRRFLGPLRAKRFDLVYNLSGDMPSALIIYLLRPREAAGLVFSRDRQYRVRNDWMRYLFLSSEVRCLNTINLADIFIETCGGAGPRAPYLHIGRDDEQHAEDLLRQHHRTSARPMIGIQAGASKDFKRWPGNCFAETADRLIRRGYGVIFFGSKSERSQVELIVQSISSPANVLNLAGETTFGQLGAFLRRCGLLLSNDTATIHAAAAVGTPTVLLTFGPTSAWETGPYGEGNLILEPDAGCFPCKWSERCAQMPCRDLLTVDVVMAAIEYMESGRAELPEALANSEVVLHRSEQMPDGLLGLRPLNRPVLRLGDALRAMIRKYYVSRWIGGGRHVRAPAWRPWLTDLFSWYHIGDRDTLARDAMRAASDFSTLGDLGKLGTQAAGALVMHGDGAASRVNAIARLADAITRLEQRVISSEENDVLRFTVAAFRHGLRDMETLPLRQAAVAHRWNYHRLVDTCLFMESALRDFARRVMKTAAAAPSDADAALCLQGAPA